MISLHSSHKEILHCLFDAWAPLRFFSHLDREELFNRAVPKVDSAEFAKHFEYLIDGGLVVAKSKMRGVFIPSFGEIEAALKSSSQKVSSRHDLLVGLTALGGKCWENAAHPDWRLYFERTGADAKFERIESVSEALTNKIVDIFRQHRNLVVSSLKSVRTAPWSPFYWKYLPEGFRVTFKTRGEHPDVEATIADLRNRWAQSFRLN